MPLAASMIPRIELNLGEFTHQHLITKLPTPITSSHDLGITQPTGEQVMSRQDWTERCPASVDTNVANCPTPQARAYDHKDKEVVVTTRIFLVDLDNKEVNQEVDDVEYKDRSTYLFKYDASDSAGNHAEQVVFALILDDKVGPEIKVCAGGGTALDETVEAASDWSLCSSSTATDVYHTEDVTDTLRYTISLKDGQTYCTNAVHDVAKRYIDTSEVGEFKVVVSAHDHAGAYGVDGADNTASVTKTVTVQDKRAPWIVVKGANPLEHECGTPFTDEGAIANDLLDTERLHKTIQVPVLNHVDSSKVGDYEIVYSAEDKAGNAAVKQVRDVSVVDTQAPKIALKGAQQIVHHSQETYVELGVTTSDVCDKGTLDLNIEWDRPFKQDELGDYTRTYTVTDASKHSTSISRTVTIVDVTAPTIQIKDLVLPHQTIEAVPDGVYSDPGAACHDYVDGDITPAVITTGSKDVNLAVPGTYEVHYNCKDASDNSAAQVTRTIVVEDKTCPVITRKNDKDGNDLSVIHVEAGFPYTDLGATAHDSLDGDISSKVTTDGDTVNESVHWVAARSCAEIKEGMRFQDVTPKDGDYFITTRADKRVKVWCDMASGETYYKCEQCSWVKPYSGAATNQAGDCSAQGLEMGWWGADDHGVKAKAKVEAKFGKMFFPESKDSSSNYYLCMARALHTHNPYLKDEIHHNQIEQAEAGKYVIVYHVKDKAQNPECNPVMRTVIVQDTLPPVISLHMKHADGTLSTAFHVGKANLPDKKGIGGVTNPAADESVNPNLAPWVDDEGTTHHVFDHPSANNVDYVIGKMPKVIDEIASPYMMAEQATTSVNGWVVAAAASAVAGVALLASSSRKAVVTNVPV
jgi:hypothetical protein